MAADRFRVIGDIIEYEGRPFARIFPQSWPLPPEGIPGYNLPTVNPSLRHEACEALETLVPEDSTDSGTEPDIEIAIYEAATAWGKLL